MALEMRPDCEHCGRDLPADAEGAMICSFECTWCEPCAKANDGRCYNCGGALQPRPTRAGDLLARHPADMRRRYSGTRASA